MFRPIGVLTLTVGVAALMACGHATESDAGPPDAGPPDAGCTFVAGQATEQEIAAAFSTAQDGARLSFCAGTFLFTNTLIIGAKNVTVQGAGASQTILDFSGQTAGSDGIDTLDHADGVAFTGFTVRDAKQNGIKVKNATGVTFDGIGATWTAADNTTHGAYGIYPVSSQKVLVQNCSVSGALDTGIYVGQSDQVIVKNNTLSLNVSGIEIENTFNADVFDNTSTDNTAGILVFDLPCLPQQGGHNVRVFNNTVLHNNTPNFAAVGNILQLIPAGTGFLVMANRDVEVFGNTIQQNETIGLAVVSYLITGKPWDMTCGYYPFPSRVSFHDNVAPSDGSANSNGKSPDPKSTFGQLFASILSLFPSSAMPSLIYDGIVDPTAPGAGIALDPMGICFKSNDVGGSATGGFTGFADLHFDQFDGTNLPMILTQDLPSFTCLPPALPAVSF